MISFQQNIELQRLNTMAVQSSASYFYRLQEANDVAEVAALAQQMQLSVKTLGEGSNLVLSESIDALVLKNEIKGIDIISEDNASVRVRVGAGENWHDFVSWCVEHGYYGLENLALIPGTVGAAPVQNIGAYGVEAGDTIVEVTAYDLVAQQTQKISQPECQFGYRESLFKQQENKYIITSVCFQLSKEFNPVISYGALSALADSNKLSAKAVFDFIVKTRQEKLPDPTVLPNAGSFFKNPVVPQETFEQLSVQWPNLVSFKTDQGVKLAAGWLIDQAGLKGCVGDEGVGCYEKQALVLINPNKASGKAVLSWAELVQAKVQQLFSVELEIEPRCW
ncbi:UDP-N-acetylmuramate dehydrogenase [Reinekea thalattae]|uniref:UDP-N-acetylenolpyruvoylglucosamine reductase n=1 Tax=Reinekea thalattae TaxID=2593301 RepID=A0A5C8Z7A8_9GAMM|nr:UDP-N-acetylmuramate dehydrogenase [Reinekea thalattae]TXR53527.1 UDP-N-acetylmuramate dehydrogenase [Reinekea thalattae]